MNPPNVKIHEIGNLNISLYKCISNDYITEKIIITEKQLFHIKKRHPEVYCDTINYINHILKEPDYIIKDKRPNTGLVIKRIPSSQKHILLVLRICTSTDKTEYKNSIITSWEISDGRLKNYLNNKEILYKRQ